MIVHLQERTKNAQFIIISLRSNMFELSDNLIGIYKTNNCTKSITVNPNAFKRDDTEEIQPTDDVNNALVQNEEISMAGDTQNCGQTIQH